MTHGDKTKAHILVVWDKDTLKLGIDFLRPGVLLVRTRTVNPIGPDGRSMLCKACGSYRHLIKDCPALRVGRIKEVLSPSLPPTWLMSFMNNPSCQEWSKIMTGEVLYDLKTTYEPKKRLKSCSNYTGIYI